MDYVHSCIAVQQQQHIFNLKKKKKKQKAQAPTMCVRLQAQTVSGTHQINLNNLKWLPAKSTWPRSFLSYSHVRFFFAVNRYTLHTYLQSECMLSYETKVGFPPQMTHDKGMLPQAVTQTIWAER